MTGDGGSMFESLYTAARAGEAEIPWDRGRPHPQLVAWTEECAVRGEGRRALVVGAGLGLDAQHLAGLGFETVAFDVAPTAVALARERLPGSPVEFHVADLLDPPPEWTQAFDLVVEVMTVQSLPPAARAQATANVAAFVARGGTLLVVATMREGDQRPGPPWPLDRAEVEAFARDGLAPVALDLVAVPGTSGIRPWVAEFARPG